MIEGLRCGEYSGITLKPAQLDFETPEGWKFIPPSQQVRTRKVGTGRSPHWTVEADEDWIRLSRNSGQGEGRVRVSCASIGMSSGFYIGAITLSSHVLQEPVRTLVTLTVKPKDPPQPPDPPPPDPPPPPPPPPDPSPPDPPPPDPSPPDEPPDEPPDDPPEENWFLRFIKWVLEKLGGR